METNESAIQKEAEGLRYPSLDDLLKIVPNKYRLAVGVGQFAKKISQKTDIEKYHLNLNKQSTTSAIEAIMAGKVKI